MPGIVIYSSTTCIYEIVKREKREKKMNKTKVQAAKLPTLLAMLCSILDYR